MTKAETFIQAWRLAAREEDFSLVDKIYHPDYSAFDHSAGVEVNLEADKQVILTLRHEIKATAPTIVSESDVRSGRRNSMFSLQFSLSIWRQSGT